MNSKFPEIKVMGYKEALEYVYNYSGNPQYPKYAIISIQEPTNGYGLGLVFKKGGNCLSALNIEFADCTPALNPLNERGMTKKDAQEIHDFVESIPEQVELLIIHCKCGQSRSVAVATALLFIKEKISKNVSNILNKYVYYNILETYGMKNLYWSDWYEKEKESLQEQLPTEILKKIKPLLEVFEH